MSTGFPAAIPGIQTGEMLHQFTFDVLHAEFEAAKRRLQDFIQQAHPPDSSRLVRVNSDRYTGLGWRTHVDWDFLRAAVLLPHGEIRYFSVRDVQRASEGTSVPAELRRAILRSAAVSALSRHGPKGWLP